MTTRKEIIRHLEQSDYMRSLCKETANLLKKDEEEISNLKIILRELLNERSIEHS